MEPITIIVIASVVIGIFVAIMWIVRARHRGGQGEITGSDSGGGSGDNSHASHSHHDSGGDSGGGDGGGD